MRSCSLLLLIAASVLASPHADASNQVVNPDFDTDVSGWIGNLSFAAGLDANDDPASGSAFVLNSIPASGSEASQRIAVTPGQPVRATFHVYIASGQSGVGYAWPALNFFEGACDAHGPYISTANAVLVAAPFDAWVPSEVSDTLPPANAGCAQVLLFVRNNGADGTFGAYFDAISAPEPDAAACALAAAAAVAATKRARARAAAASRRS